MNRPTGPQGWRQPPFNNNGGRGPPPPPHQQLPPHPGGRGGMMGNNIQGFHRGGGGPPSFQGRGGRGGPGPAGPGPFPPNGRPPNMMMNGSRGPPQPPHGPNGRGPLNNMLPVGPQGPSDPRIRENRPPPLTAPNMGRGSQQQLPPRGPGRGNFPPFGGRGPMNNNRRQPLPPPPPSLPPRGPPGRPNGMINHQGPRGPPPPLQHHQPPPPPPPPGFRGPPQHQQPVPNFPPPQTGFQGGPPPPPPAPVNNNRRPGLAPLPNSMPFPPPNNHLAQPPPTGAAGALHQQQRPPPVHTRLHQPYAQPRISPPSQLHGQIGPQQPAPPIQPPAANSYTKEQEDKAWTEHDAPDGRKYYHNSLTKQSVYDKPECLTEKQENPKLVERPWAEYEDPGTGNKYYSNGIITQWTKPEAMEKEEKDAAATSTTKQNGVKEPSSVSEPSNKKRKRTAEMTEFHNKDEAVAGFKGLLLAKDITPAQKWNEVVKICSSDVRWEACENVLTTGERKQALAEYQTKRANDLRTIERQERQRTREAFVQLLSDLLPTVSGFSAKSSRFEDVRPSLTKDDRFHAVADEATRESLFLDFCEEFRKREERKRHNKRRDAKENFLSFLKENEEAGRLSYASTWNSFVSSLSDEDRRDARFDVSNHMSDDDRQVYFADFVIELQTLEDDKRRRIRDARRRAEKAQREAYRDTLTRLAEASELLPTSRWRDLDTRLSRDPSYGPLTEQDREAPREIFQEFVDDWSESYRRDRSILGRIANQSSSSKKTNPAISKDLTYDQFTAALLETVRDSADLHDDLRRIINGRPVSSARLYFDEIRQRVSSRRVSLRQGGEESSEDEGEIVEDGELEEPSESDGKKADDEDSENQPIVSTERELQVDA